jgi:hypothetical protein
LIKLCSIALPVTSVIETHLQALPAGTLRSTSSAHHSPEPWTVGGQIDAAIRALDSGIVVSALYHADL